MRIEKLTIEYLDEVFGFEKNFIYVKMIYRYVYENLMRLGSKRKKIILSVSLHNID